MADVTQIPIISLGVIALVGLLAGLILTRVGLPSSIGYILVGILLGPLALGFLAPGESLAQLFGEIGVLMLLFYLGLELSIEKFKQNSGIALALVFVEFVTAFVAGFAVSKLFGFNDLEAVIIGGMLPFASTVIVVKFLMEKRILDWPESRLAISSLIIEDFAAIIVLVFLTSVSSAKSLNVLVVNGLLFVVAMFFIVRKLSKHALSLLRSAGQEDKMALYAVGIGIVVGYFGHVLGLSAVLGAYFVGFALAETDYAERIKRELGLFREFFILFFFVSFGASIVFPAASTLYLLLGFLLLAYVVSKILAYGIFGSAIGLNPSSAITTGVLMTPIGEFSIIIASAAAPLVARAPDIMSLAFLLTITTGVTAPLLFGRREVVTDLFLRLYPLRFRKALRAVGKEMHVVEKLAKAFQTDYWISVQNLLKNFVIVLAVVYIAAILNTQIILPSFPDIPSSATLALLILPFIVWPIYRTLQELRFLVESLVSRFVHPQLVEKTSEALVGLFLTLASVFVAAWLYAQKVAPLFLLIPVIYLVLAIVFLSKACWSFFEKLERIQEIAGVRAREDLRGLAKTFDDHNELLARLNDLRAKARDEIAEALRAGKPAKARRLLTEFRKREASFLEALKRSSPVHPFKKRKKRGYLEGYFYGRLKKKK